MAAMPRLRAGSRPCVVLLAMAACVASIVTTSRDLRAGERQAGPSHGPAGHHGVGHNELHHWYRTLRAPGNGAPCCDGKDCRPTRARMRNGSLEVLVNGAWARVPSGALLKEASPDLQTHVCAQPSMWGADVIFCVVLGQGV